MGHFNNMSVDQINFEEEIKYLRPVEKTRMLVALLADLNEKENKDVIYAGASFLQPVVKHAKQLLDELISTIEEAQQ